VTPPSPFATRPRAGYWVIELGIPEVAIGLSGYSGIVPAPCNVGLYDRVGVDEFMNTTGERCIGVVVPTPRSHKAMGDSASKFTVSATAQVHIGGLLFTVSSALKLNP